jgi:hypothetical protein
MMVPTLNNTSRTTGLSASQLALHAPRHHQRLASHVAPILRQQEGHRCSHVLRPAQALQRCLLDLHAVVWDARSSAQG